MPYQSPIFWVILAVLWIGAALHMGATMRSIGRRWWVWFLLSLFVSVLPATIVYYVDWFGNFRRQQLLAQAGRRRTPGRQAQPDAAAPLPDAQADEAADAEGAGSARSAGAELRRCEHCGQFLRPDEIARAGGREICPRCNLPLGPTDIA